MLVLINKRMISELSVILWWWRHSDGLLVFVFRNHPRQICSPQCETAAGWPSPCCKQQGSFFFSPSEAVLICFYFCGGYFNFTSFRPPRPPFVRLLLIQYVSVPASVSFETAPCVGSGSRMTKMHVHSFNFSSLDPRPLFPASSLSHSGDLEMIGFIFPVVFCLPTSGFGGCNTTSTGCVTLNNSWLAVKSWNCPKMNSEKKIFALKHELSL